MSAFYSKLRPHEVLIDDGNAAARAPINPVINGERKLMGYVPRDRSKVPEGSMPFSRSFDLPKIPRSEWPERIEEMEKTKTRLSDISDAQGIQSLDQNGTNFCWCNAVVGALQLVRAHMGEPYVKLSPASVAAPIKGYSNQGGWGGEALSYIVKHGIASIEHWPANAINRSYDNAQSQANRELHKVTEWLDLPEGDFEAVMTCLFHRIPVAVGLSWWSHEVLYCDPVMFGRDDFGVRFRNSWSNSYGDHGFNTLHESKARPSDACAVLVPTASIE